MKKILKKILIISIIFVCFFILSGSVLAQGLKDSSSRTEAIASYGGYSEEVTAIRVVGSIMTGALSIIGMVFLIILIYGGYLWMTGKENEQQTEKAKNTIKAAIIGLLIVVGAYAISYFVVSTTTGDKVLKSEQAEEVESE